MNKLLLLLLISLLPACTTLYYRDGDAEFSRTSFGTQLQIRRIEIVKTLDGRKSVSMHGYVSDQVEALRAVTEAAVDAAVKGATP